MTLSPGTAKIVHQRTGWYVEYMNVGSWLRCQPRWFETCKAAEKFCRDRSLRVVDEIRC